MYNEKIVEFADILKDCKRAVFFGGAGVSTESGVRDYRSEDGLYNTVKQYGVSPEVILSHTFFENNPDVFYDFYYTYFLAQKALPNAAHKTLARLEEMGKLSAVVTQNVDGLHQAAGSKRVYELHGTSSVHYCSKCGAGFDTERVALLKGKVPICERCGGVIRPDIVLYEEPLKERVVYRAIDAIASADLLIIGGTSLAVYPAAAYIRYFGGDKIVLINKGEVEYTGKIDLVFHENIGKVLSETVALL
ncbi:MAG: NAD-dependent protein deacylase [Clostridia bacterium]|nr:NAD-dependent protein deacylase [Clostridia bacterium]